MIFLIAILFFRKKSLKIFFADFLLYLFLFYFILILFWVDTHSNIITLPIEFFIKTFSLDVGWGFNLLNGNYFNSREIPYNYLFVNYFYKLPEFLVILYAFSIPILFFNRKLIKSKIKNFKTVILITFFDNLP